MTDDFNESVRNRANADVKRLLREYGATGIQVLNRRETVVDFQTPFPGDQPIASGLEIEDGVVTRGTIRYGVLDKERFTTGPHDHPPSLRRLRRAVETTTPPGSLAVNVGFGDADRVPRPHVRLGWRPNDAGVQVIQNRSGGSAPVKETVEYIKRVGKEIRDEFGDEYVDPVPGLANAPLPVSEFVNKVRRGMDATDIEVRPSSRDGYEIRFTFTRADESRAIVTDEGDVLQYDVYLNTGFSAPTQEEWEDRAEEVGVPDSAFVTVDGSQKEVSYRSSIADGTLSVEEALEQIRRLRL